MSQINVIEVPTSHGFKTIELHHSDITQLPFNVDLLVISAFERAYHPTPNTVIKAIEDNMQLSVNELANEPFLDLRNELGCWISQKLDNEAVKYLGCVENIARNTHYKGTPEEVIANIFGIISMLHYKQIDVSTIAMPILGAGSQGTPIVKVLPLLIENAVNALNHNNSLKTICFVERTEDKIKGIDKQINKLQQRSKETLEQVYNSDNENILQEILSKLIQIKNQKYILNNSASLNSLIETINDKNVRFFELGISSRKFIESLLLEFVGQNKLGKSLYFLIGELFDKNVSALTINYFHTIRTFGNHFAHSQISSTLSNKLIYDDLLIFLIALNRTLDFTIKFGAKLKSYQ